MFPMLTAAIRMILNPSDDVKAQRIIKKYGLTVFDPSPATCYSDSACSTLTTQDGVIGGIVDSNATLGPEVVTNGGFNSDTAWTKNQPTAGSVTISGGTLNLNTTDGSYCSAIQTCVSSGKTYKITLTVTMTTGVFSIAIGPGVTYPTSSSGTYTIYLTANSTQIELKRNSPGVATQCTVDNISVREVTGRIATQSTAGYKPILRRGAKNLLLNSDTLSTQNVTTKAIAYTLQFKGTGTVTLSGTSTAGPLIGTGANNLVTLTFTPTAGTLTLTVSGSVTSAMLNTGSTAEPYIATTSVPLSNGIGPWWLDFDGVDDYLALSAVPFQMADNSLVMSVAKTLLSATNGRLFSIRGATSTPIISQLGFASGAPQVTWHDDASAQSQITGSSVVGQQVAVSALRTTANKLRINTVQINSDSTALSTTTVTTATIGSTALGTKTEFHSGPIYNLILGKLNTPISESELKIIEKYFAKKAGLII